MCGIVAILNSKSEAVSPVILRQMTDALKHRGPDNQSIFIDRHLGLGHTRLSIIDTSSSANQPMLSADGRYVITFNGEIFNFAELRAELSLLGHQFVTKSDTEVLLYAYIAWGKDALNKLNGMFAFAIWDKYGERLFVGRDRYGIKPLYLLQSETTLLLASEIKSILKHPLVSTELDKQGLVEYLTFQNFFSDRTLFKGVQIMPAGSFFEASTNSTEKHIVVGPYTRYWDFDFRDPTEAHTKEEYLEELDRLFRQAVSRQLVSDVPVGTYLSGGIDSGSITAVASSQLPYLQTFTCGFDFHSASGLEMAVDERKAAEYMSYLFKTEHYETVLKAGDMERILPKLTWHLEEPRVGQSYPNFYISQLASKFVKVVLGGSGGDELFAGYPWRYYRAVVNDNFEDYIDKYYSFWQRLIPGERVDKIFEPIRNDAGQVSPRDIFASVFSSRPQGLDSPSDYVNYSLYFEAKTFLHGLLVVEDKLSMAHGLESRVPFLDNDLVDFAMQVPVGLKLGNLEKVVRWDENEPGPKTTKYFEKARDGKLILRKAMAKHVPKEIISREKQGFSAPDASWFRGESIAFVKSRLTGADAKIFNLLDRSSVQELVEEHIQGKQNRRLLIWSLLNLEEWCDCFLD